MAHFLPKDAQKADQLKATFSATLFQTPEHFISLYNSGFISKKNEEVHKLARAIVATYKDVKESGGQLVFISTEEIRLEELASLLEQWSFIVKVKREIETLSEEEELAPASVIYFLPSAPGYLQVQEEDGSYRRLSQEKTCGKQAVVASVYYKYSQARDEELEEEQIYAFTVDNFLSQDASFVERMIEVAPH